MITLKQITNFLALAAELHFARAAEKLGISQAALSMDIRKLEKSLNAQLFDRSDRWQIHLTEAGNTYYQHVKNIPEQLGNARQSVQRAARGESGSISIVVANAVYDSLDVGAIFKKMFTRYPGVKMKINDRQSSPQVAELVRSGQCDAGLMAHIHGLSSLAGLRKIRIMDSGMYFAFPLNHPLARKKNLSLEDLCNASFISSPRDEAPLMRRFFEEFFLSRGLRVPEVAYEVAGLRAIRQLVAAGLGVALIPFDNKEKKIVFRKVPGNLNRSIIVVWDENNHSPALHNFLSLIPKMTAQD